MARVLYPGKSKVQSRFEFESPVAERRDDEQIMVRLATAKLTWNLQYNGALALAPNTYVCSPKRRAPG